MLIRVARKIMSEKSCQKFWISRLAQDLSAVSGMAGGMRTEPTNAGSLKHSWCAFWAGVNSTKTVTWERYQRRPRTNFRCRSRERSSAPVGGGELKIYIEEIPLAVPSVHLDGLPAA